MIDDISNDIKTQLLERLKQTYFAIQLDESINIANCAQLLVYMQYYWGRKMIKNFVFCHQMQSKITSLDIFNVLCNFFCYQICHGSNVWI